MPESRITDIPEPPVPQNEDKRLEALQSFNIMDTLPEDEFDSLARLASHICNVPVSLINFIDTGKQFTKACVGVEFEDMPRSQSVCQYTIMSKEIFEVFNLAGDPRFKDKPYVKGDPKYRFYAGAPLVTEDGHAIGSLCVLDYKPGELNHEQKRDLEILADEVMARLRLRKREKMLERMNAFKERLLKVVSHDIRSPLTGITGAAEYLEEDDVTEEEKTGLIEIINESASQIQHIVGELLDSQLVEFGKLNSNIEQYEVDYGIKGIINLFKFSAKNKNITLDYSIEDDIPTIKLDEQKYERIIANLLSNAIKFTKRGGSIHVYCAYQQYEDQANKLITKVEDDGIGMSDELLQNLFKHKDEGGRSGTENESSYGLGMYIVKKLCKVCNAEISVESEEGEGTVFTLMMPAPPAAN